MRQHLKYSILIIMVLHCGKLQAVLTNSTPPTSDAIQPKPAVACEEEWVFYNDHCYLIVVDVARTWYSAKKSCENKRQNAHLVSLDSEGEFSFINDQTQNIKPQVKVWLWTSGRRDPFHQDQWIWDDKSSVETLPSRHRFWCKNQPNNWNNEQDHILIEANSKCLHDIKEAELLRYICEYDPAKMTSSTPPINGAPLPTPTCRCKDEWVFYDGHCYLFVVDAARTWYSAKKTCKGLRQTAHLVTLDNEGEFIFIKDRIENVRPQEKIWLWTSGRRDPLQQDQWIWDDNITAETLPSRHQFWCKDQPNNWNNEQDHILIEANSKCLHDIKEAEFLRYICEYDPAIEKSSAPVTTEAVEINSTPVITEAIEINSTPVITEAIEINSTLAITEDQTNSTNLAGAAAMKISSTIATAKGKTGNCSYSLGLLIGIPVAAVCVVSILFGVVIAIMKKYKNNGGESYMMM